ncbi:uncharacterized protein LOC107465236 [Arachis duranensis]|uniref:Uncharacterized protein LOC107465236 n=1 Tax=Arachis duranensis TaxID=130453 RepID=A0A6P4BH24_ARADU|nr:uncharacterized protein LOC107465236 [Arachis duranensis]
MVLLDENGGKIHASIKRALVSRFVNLLKEGISYQIRYFGVGLNEDNFKTTHHEFNFVNFDTLNAPGYDYTYLVDVIRYLAGIGSERTLEKDDKFTKYTIIELEINNGKIMECALFDNYAHELNDFLGSGNKDGAVVVLEFVRLKLYNGKIVLQNFMYGTKMFFNLEEANKGDLSDTPTLLLNLIDKTFLFIIEVQISDNPDFSPSYKVKMTDNVDLINKFEKAHPIQFVSTVISDVDYTGGLLSFQLQRHPQSLKGKNQDEGETKRFTNWILDVRNGNIGSVVDDESEIEISDNL